MIDPCHAKSVEKMEQLTECTKAKHPKQDYKKTTFESAYHLLKIEVAAPIQFEETTLIPFLVSTMITMFGLVDSAFPIDIIHIEPSTHTCIVRIPWEERDRFERSMAAAISWQGMKCRVTSLKASPFLLNLL